MKPSYEELEARCAALAAENAELKAAASCLVSEYMMNKGTDSEFIACITPSKKTIGMGGAWDMWRYLDLTLNKTPATDAFLAEVRAQGVEMFAKKKREEAQTLHSDTFALGSVVASLDMQANELEDFAAQLRQEAK